MSDDITHSFGCWVWHHDCAINEIHRLTAYGNERDERIATLEQERDQARREFDVAFKWAGEYKAERDAEIERLRALLSEAQDRLTKQSIQTYGNDGLGPRGSA